MAFYLWTLADLNRSPLPCHGSALPDELRARKRLIWRLGGMIIACPVTCGKINHWGRYILNVTLAKEFLMNVPSHPTVFGLPLVRVYKLTHSSRNGRLVSVTFRTDLPHDNPVYHVPVTNICKHRPLQVIIKVSDNNIFPELADWVGQTVVLQDRTDDRVLEFE